MIHYTVNIAVDPPGLVPQGGSVGNFIYTPALLRVEAGDQVTWTCSSAFVLVFKEGTPLDQVQLVGCACQGTSGFSTGIHTVQQVRGQFHYAVAVWDGQRVLMDAACAGLSVN